MSSAEKERPKAVEVPTIVELAKKKAQDDSQKQKDSKKKGYLPYLAVGAVVLIAVIAIWVFILSPPYKYSFNISGVDFVSNDYTPSEFFSQFKDNNSFLIVIDIKDGESNAWTVNAMNLWLVGLNADGKRVTSLVQLVDSSGAQKSCTTNDANVLVSRDVPLSECSAMLSDSSKAQVVLKLSNKNSVLMEQNKVEISATGADTISPVNYYAIKQMYPDFDKTLAIVNERINSINN